MCTKLQLPLFKVATRKLGNHFSLNCIPFFFPSLTASLLSSILTSFNGFLISNPFPLSLSSDSLPLSSYSELTHFVLPSLPYIFPPRKRFSVRTIEVGVKTTLFPDQHTIRYPSSLVPVHLQYLPSLKAAVSVILSC